MFEGARPSPPTPAPRVLRGSPRRRGEIRAAKSYHSFTEKLDRACRRVSARNFYNAAVLQSVSQAEPGLPAYLAGFQEDERSQIAIEVHPFRQRRVTVRRQGDDVRAGRRAGARVGRYAPAL